MRLFQKIPIRYPIATIFVLVGVSLYLGSLIPSIGHQPVFDGLPESDPWVKDHKKVAELFPNRNFVSFLIVKEDGILTREGIALVHAFVEDAKHFPGRTSTVFSFLSYRDISVSEDEVRISALVGDTLPTTDEELLALRGKVENDSLIFGKLVSKSLKGAYIRFAVDDSLPQDKVEKAVDDLIAPHLARGETIYTFAKHHMNAKIEHGTNRDILFRIGPAGLLCIVLLTVLVLPVGAPVPVLGTITLSLMCGFGTMALLGIPRSVLSSPIALIVIAIVASPAIHFLVWTRRYYHGEEQVEVLPESFLRSFPYEKRNLVSALYSGLHHVTRPILVSAATTALSFGALLLFPIYSVRDFGYYAASGVLWGAIHTLFFLPAFVMILPKKHHPVCSGENTLIRWINRGHKRVIDFWNVVVFERTRLFTFVVFALLVVSVFGIFSIRVDSHLPSLYPKGSYTKESFLGMKKEFGANGGFTWVFDSGESMGIYHHEFMQKLHAFNKWAEESHEEVVFGNSLSNVVARLNREYDGREDVPDDDRLIYGYLESDFASAARDEFFFSVTPDRRYIAVDYAVDATSSYELARFSGEMKEEADRVFGKTRNLAFGDFLMWSRQTPYIATVKVWNVIVAILLVGIMCALAYRSAVVGVVCIVPVSLTAVVVFGSMGLSGIYLDLAGAVVTSLSIGVGADFAVHFVDALIYVARRKSNKYDAVHDALFAAGAPIQYNAMIVTFGVILLVFSGFPPVQNFGTLAASSLILSALFTLTIIPILVLALSLKVARFLEKEIARDIRSRKIVPLSKRA